MRARYLCLALALICGVSVVAEERGKKSDTGLIFYNLSNSSSQTVKLIMFYGKQKRQNSTDISIEQRALATAQSKKSKQGSTAVTFSLIAGPNGKDIEFDVFDSHNNKLGSKGYFVEPNTPPHPGQGDTIDPKDEMINVGINPSNQVFFTITPKSL